MTANSKTNKDNNMLEDFHNAVLVEKPLNKFFSDANGPVCSLISYFDDQSKGEAEQGSKGWQFTAPRTPLLEHFSLLSCLDCQTQRAHPSTVLS